MTDAAPYLSVDALRQAMPDLRSETNFPDETLTGLIAGFARLAERARGCAFTVREATETVYVDRRATGVMLKWPFVREVTTFTLDGDDLTATKHLNADAGILLYPAGIGCGDLVVSYTHGITETPPLEVIRACRLYVWREAMADKNPNTGNAYSTTTQGQDGYAFTERQSTPDWSANRFTGWLDVDKILNQLDDYRTPGIG